MWHDHAEKMSCKSLFKNMFNSRKFLNKNENDQGRHKYTTSKRG